MIFEGDDSGGEDRADGKALGRAELEKTPLTEWEVNSLKG
jgi:hypothetical protein